jgi:hypothetical protein
MDGNLHIEAEPANSLITMSPSLISTSSPDSGSELAPCLDFEPEGGSPWGRSFSRGHKGMEGNGK